MRDTLNGLEEKRNVQCFSDIREIGRGRKGSRRRDMLQEVRRTFVNFIRLHKS